MYAKYHEKFNLYITYVDFTYITRSKIGRNSN